MNFYKSTFFDSYTALTDEYIQKKLSADPKAASESSLYDGLSEKQFKLVLDEGAVLEYAFYKDDLTLSENGSAPVRSPYSAKQLGEIVLFTHLIPNSLRGWAVIANLRTRLVTVYEMWFGSYERAKREVWREYMHGYIDDGGDVPDHRHGYTNRIENMGTYWKDDDGTETLLFFPSVIYSSFVELSDPRGGITITTPSDYFKIDDRYFIYSRVDCEFSGALTLEVMDLMTIEHIGVRLGFNIKDDLVYKVYHGQGEITGRAAHLEELADYGVEIKLGSYAREAFLPPPRGKRPAYRPLAAHHQYTKEETAEIVRTNTKIFESRSIMSSRNTMDATDYIVGKVFSLKYDDGEEYQYDVISIDRLKWRIPNGEWQEERYTAIEPAPDIIFFSHMLTGSEPIRNFSPAMDFSTGLVTNVNAWLGCEIGEWQVAHKAQFGVIICDGITPPEVRRHSFTTDLTGKIYSWTYSEAMKSIHVYSSPESYSWTIMLEGGAGGLMWSSPCFYVKLRDDAYLLSWTEDNCNGNQGSIVFNPRIMHDGGFFFGIGEGEVPDLHLTTTGAFGRDLGTFDIKKYF